MKSLQGHFLVASPKLVDPNFFQTVVLMVQHDEAGAFGVVVNRPVETTVEEMWREVADEACAVEGTLYQGGPCEGPLMVVHQEVEHSEIEVTAGVYFCTRKDTIEQFVAQSATESRFFAGYAGWTAGQLEAELEEGGWLTMPATAGAIFGDPEQLWNSLVRKLGLAKIWPGLDLERIPEDPSVN